MEWMYSPEAWVALATLTFLEIVLGIDNIIFIAILVGRLPPEQRKRGRVIGLGFAMGTRILLLFEIVAGDGGPVGTQLGFGLFDLVDDHGPDIAEAAERGEFGGCVPGMRAWLRGLVRWRRRRL